MSKQSAADRLIMAAETDAWGCERVPLDVALEELGKVESRLAGMRETGYRQAVTGILRIIDAGNDSGRVTHSTIRQAIAALAAEPSNPYRLVDCVKCGRMRVLLDGECEKCGWHNDLHDYAAEPAAEPEENQ